MLPLLFGLVFIAFLIWLILAYNKFVEIKNAIESTFNQIRVAMKKRFDMIGQLVEITKSYIKYEKDVLTEITKLRASSLETPEDIDKASQTFNSLLGTIKVSLENYPDLKAQKPVAKLMEEITNVEEEIARLRYLYNDQVQMYNVMVEKFPTNIAALILGYSKKPYLKFQQEIENPVNTVLYEK